MFGNNRIEMTPMVLNQIFFIIKKIFDLLYLYIVIGLKEKKIAQNMFSGRFLTNYNKK